MFAFFHFVRSPFLPLSLGCRIEKVSNYALVIQSSWLICEQRQPRSNMKALEAFDEFSAAPSTGHFNNFTTVGRNSDNNYDSFVFIHNMFLLLCITGSL